MKVFKRKAHFLDLPLQYSRQEESIIAIIPVPFEKTVTWKKGTAHGPAAIIDASGQVELYDIETDFEAYKHGIFTHRGNIKLTSSEMMIKSVNNIVKYYLDKDKLPVILGGEHSVSIGAVKAVAEKTSNFTVLQLDAHADLRNTYKGSGFNHACVMARIKELCPVVQVGIRSMDWSEKKSLDPDRVIYAKDIRNSRQDGSWQDKVLNLLSGNVYISVDLDVFDPAIMPSTGTPEPGGLDWYEVTGLLKKIFCKKNVLGFDVVELCPGEHHSSNFLAAKLIYKLISYYLFYRDSKTG